MISWALCICNGLSRTVEYCKYSVLKDNEGVAYIMSSDRTKKAFTKVEWVLTDAKTYRPIKYFSPMRTKSVPAFEKAKAYAREYYS